MSAMVTCPGCQAVSTETDWCNSCGLALGASPPPRGPASTSTVASPAPGLCANCGAERIPGDGFCELCGYNFETGETPQAPLPPRPATSCPPTSAPGLRWSVIVTADLEFFKTNRAVDGCMVTFPGKTVPTKVPLTGQRVVIGRATSAAPHVQVVDVSALTGDPGVSRLHALLVAQDDGSWTIEDTESTNGTWVNDEPDPLRPHSPVTVGDGDRVHVGAYTVMIMSGVVGTQS